MLTITDWTVVITYLAALVSISGYLSRQQETVEDYFVASNTAGPVSIALSVMATQCSTNSILGAPAFVAFVVGGGLVWLQYELALPLAHDLHCRFYDPYLSPTAPGLGLPVFGSSV